MIGYDKRVLVVDNEKAIRELLAAQLEQHEFLVVQAGDGLEALSELQKRHFHAMITDERMPYLDGLDLLWQSRLTWPNLPVILLSDNHEQIAEFAAARGAYACLPKPVDVRQLMSLLSAVMEQSDALWYETAWHP
jgi:DNA-binding response OmpR family regulator